MQKSIIGTLTRCDLDTKIGHVRANGLNYKVNLEKFQESQIKDAFVSVKLSTYTGIYKNKILIVDNIEVGGKIPPESV
jgi:hypothetical protein